LIIDWINRLNNKNSDLGFTLLEVMIVISIMALIAALAWPAMGLLDDNERRKRTIAKMEIIREAIIGPQDQYDETCRRIIGGYVGDMKKFPDLWEARAQVKPGFVGATWPAPADGLGQGPSYALNPDLVFFRPAGRFDNKKWKWNRPYRKLFDDSVNNIDHIGGLGTENEGQPRGLWTRFTEELSFDLPGHPKPGMIEGENWKGPYILSPVDKNLKAGAHYAESDDDYRLLAPVWIAASAWETWEEGDYDPTNLELGEFYDEKEKFRLLKNGGRLIDGWERSFRFFITADKDRPGSQIFWIISEGPDYDGKYPTKGSCNGRAWTKDPSNTMAEAYDPDTKQNKDNIVMKIFSHEFEAIFLEEKIRKEQESRGLVENIRKALTGDSPHKGNDGFTGDMQRLPHLFRWEPGGGPDQWDNEDGAAQAYTKGQPRGLWTDRPNAQDAGDDIAASIWGTGWRTKYFPKPHGEKEDEIIVDPWEREVLFFNDTTHKALLVLSRGEDAKFDFGAMNPDKTEPMNFIENVDVTTYNPLLPENLDNIYTVINGYEYHPGYICVEKIIVLNATAGTIKARLFRGEELPLSPPLVSAAPWTDEDGDTVLDDWSTGDAGTPAFEYNDTTAGKIHTGARYLVFWNDTDGDNEIDTGENFKAAIFNVTAAPGTNQVPQIKVNSTDFIPAP